MRQSEGQQVGQGEAFSPRVRVEVTAWQGGTVALNLDGAARSGQRLFRKRTCVGCRAVGSFDVDADRSDDGVCEFNGGVDQSEHPDETGQSISRGVRL